MSEKNMGYRNPFPTTDVIIEYNDGRKDGVVLVERLNPPFGLAIPGGFAEWGLSFPDNARKEAKEETGLDIEILHDEDRPFLVPSAPHRDPRGHMTGNVYIARGCGRLMAGDDAKRAFLFTREEIRRLIAEQRLVFDHGMILEKYLRWNDEGRAYW